MMATKAQIKELQKRLAQEDINLSAVAESARISKETIDLGRQEAAANREVIKGLREASEAKKAEAAKKKAAVKPITYTATDGTPFTDKDTYDRYQAMLTDKASIADTRKREAESAYNILYKKFSEFGLGSLVQEVERYIKDGLSEDEFTLRLRETESYQKRFAANKQRIAKGLSALSEAEYIGMEDKYQEVMRQYGLPESYYSKDPTGKQVGFE